MTKNDLNTCKFCNPPVHFETFEELVAHGAIHRTTFDHAHCKHGPHEGNECKCQAGQEQMFEDCEACNTPIVK